MKNFGKTNFSLRPTCFAGQRRLKDYNQNVLDKNSRDLKLSQFYFGEGKVILFARSRGWTVAEKALSLNNAVSLNISCTAVASHDSEHFIRIIETKTTERLE